VRAEGLELSAVGISRDDGGLSGAALYRCAEECVSVLQAAALDDASAVDALLSAAEVATELHLHNAPAHERFSHALDGLGANVRARQYEMRLRLA
jgi:hypothetical protein